MTGARLDFGDFSDQRPWLREILTLRTLRKWTQADLARELGVHRNTVWNWENYLSEPDAETVMPLVRALLEATPARPLTPRGERQRRRLRARALRAV